MSAMNDTGLPDELLTTPECGKVVRLSPATLERMRREGGPSSLPYIKLGNKKRSKVVYSRRAVLEWLARQQINGAEDDGQ